jgi:HEAT repeat protein
VAAPLDPIFQTREPDEQTPRTVRLLWQFFFFPLLIVAACLVPVVIVLATRGVAPTPKDLLEQVRTGGDNAKRQSAQQLAHAIGEARTKADDALRAGKDPGDTFFVDKDFTAGLRDAYRVARNEEQSEERQIWLAMALGRTADPEAVPLLLETLYPPKDSRTPEPSQDVRRAAAKGLLFMESRAAEDALVMASADPEDSEIRAIAMNGLALLGMSHGGAAADGPQVAPALKRGLADAHSGVQLNAAYALGVRGDPAGLDLLERSLTRSELGRLGVADEYLQLGALVNAVRGVVALSSAPWGARDAALVARIEGLKGRIEVLARDDGDENVRHIAREGLKRWRKQ